MDRLSPEIFQAVVKARKRQFLASAEAEEASSAFSATVTRAILSADKSPDDHTLCMKCGCVVPKPAAGQPAACACNSKPEGK